MAKKKNKTSKQPAFKEKTRKKGTYYDRNRVRLRTKEQQRRADVKAGKITPKTGSKPRGKEPKYRNESDRREYKTGWKREKV